MIKRAIVWHYVTRGKSIGVMAHVMFDGRGGGEGANWGQISWYHFWIARRLRRYVKRQENLLVHEKKISSLLGQRWQAYHAGPCSNPGYKFLPDVHWHIELAMMAFYCPTVWCHRHGLKLGHDSSVCSNVPTNKKRGWWNGMGNRAEKTGTFVCSSIDGCRGVDS